MGDKVLLASPALPNPFLKVPELSVTGPDEARIAQAGAFGSYGEPVRRIRGEDGAVAKVRVAGDTALPETALREELDARYG
jgi:hypothetical protein